MLARFLLGPAGSGKTCSCIAEIRRELMESPEGPPLILLAPKQATFQLERQLLAGNDPSPGEVASPRQGYTRLRIFGFEKLAAFLLERLGVSPPQIVSEECRVMVLRALLSRHSAELTAYRGSAKRAGFVRELSGVLAELQQHRVPPQGMRKIAASRGEWDPLGMKLRDLALLQEAYQNWLKPRALWDAGHQLERAAQALTRLRTGEAMPIAPLPCEIWLDGFAELTPQELWLLLALAPHLRRLTMTFCLEAHLPDEPGWFSLWSPVGRLYRRCLGAFSAQAGTTVSVETLERRREIGRFAGSELLAHLEEHWADASPYLPAAGNVEQPAEGQMSLSLDPAAVREQAPDDALAIFQCPNPEAEAVLACRELRRFARAGGRYRDAAILLRSMEGYSDVLPRLLARYEIPYFLDRREPMAHHPLAELTQYCLRVLVHDWRREDLFGAWKTGLFPVEHDCVDRLENEGLAHGWEGETWRGPLPLDADLEGARQTLAGPLLEFTEALGTSSSFAGPALATALARLWKGLRVGERLEEWDDQRHERIHGTVWREMEAWRENLALAFSDQELGAREWLATVEAGLAGLTVGTIPPALDQVLIGAVDRSRNPDLQLVIILGLNERLFPQTPPAPRLLNEMERNALVEHEVRLDGNRQEFIARERFLGYIACTRSRQRLVLACASRNEAGEPLNPSPFLDRIKALFPGTPVQTESVAFGWENAEHYCELLGPALREERNSAGTGRVSALLNLPAMQTLRDRLPAFRAVEKTGCLPAGLAQKVLGPDLRTSVSSLEKFAACPFQFFVHHTLRGRERPVFELGVRERGSFSHEVLAAYHRRLEREGLRWRDLSPDMARATVRDVAAEVAGTFHEGLLKTGHSARFSAAVMTRRVEDFVAMETAWMRRYAFDPWKVEVCFGLGEEPELPAWRIELAEGRALVLVGKIDRVDLQRDETGARAVVIDYKSESRTLDPVLMRNGVAMQLPAYLNALRQAGAAAIGTSVIPAGMFYAPLRGKHGVSDNRDEDAVEDDSMEGVWKAFQFRGRFVWEMLQQFDNEAGPGRKASHYAFRIKKNGFFYFQDQDPKNEAEFIALLDENVEILRQMAERICQGEARLDPYKKGKQRACDRCDCQAICRVDLWSQPFRELSSGANETEEAS